MDRTCSALSLLSLFLLPSPSSPSMIASTAHDFSSLKINPDRLNASIHSTAEFGAALRYGPAPTETGMARLALDDNDKLVRQYVIEEVKKLGCTVTVDQMGNIFAVRPGKKEGAPTGMGSHLDTQPTGALFASRGSDPELISICRWKVRRYSGRALRTRGAENDPRGGLDHRVSYCSHRLDQVSA